MKGNMVKMPIMVKKNDLKLNYPFNQKKSLPLFKHFLFNIILLSSICIAQSDQEMIHESQYILDEIVVVGDRVEEVLKKSTSATAVLTESELNSIPSKNLAEALNYLTGIVFVNQDASGNKPVPIIRGFYGGGEAEYILLNVNGIPINDLTSGLINWSLVPIDNIKRIEITRGGGSAVYGDMAIGGVINVITETDELNKNTNLNIIGGQFGNKGINVSQSFRFSNHGLQLNANLIQNNGFRDHSKFENNKISTSYLNNSLPIGKLRLNFDYSSLNQDEAGPLTEELLKQNRKQSNMMFSNDNQLREQLDFAISFISSEKQNNKVPPYQLSVRAGMRSYDQTQTRTLQLTSQLGDSQLEDQDNQILWGQTQYEQDFENTKFIAGVETEFGVFNSKYYDIGKTSQLSNGSGQRSKWGFYVEGKHAFNRKIGATLGTHFDLIENSGKVNEIPQDKSKINHVSPRVGLHYQYFESQFFEGNFFINWSKAFKAPSLDQLYDTRIINFYYQEINYANPSLVPQESTNLDLGLYQKFGFPSSAISGEISLAYYSLDIKNEIDFDMATFKYGNISKSMHSGIEGSFGLYLANRIRLNSTFNIMDVTFGDGENKGNQLKNIPRITYTNRFTIKVNSIIDFVVAHRLFGEAFLDDANTASLPAYNAIDSKLQLKLDRFSLSFDIFNIMNKLYNSGGYMLFDPLLQENVKFLYPSQGRYLQAKIGYSL